MPNPFGEEEDHDPPTPPSTNTKVLDSGTTAEFQALGAATYGFRPTP